MNVYIMGVISTLLLAGCVVPKAPPPKVYVYTYDLNTTKLLNEKVGSGTISGNAFLRKRGGGVVTCAGNTVRLFPKTAYSTEQIIDDFGKSTDGYKPNNTALYRGYILGELSNKEFKETLCDSSGNFSFEKIADGEYFTVTSVSWDVPTTHSSNTQGGYLMKSIKILNNETKKIILSH